MFRQTQPTKPWEVIIERSSPSSETLHHNILGPEIVRLEKLSEHHVTKACDRLKKLAADSSPTRAILAIHEAGHAFPYLSIYPDGGLAYATLSDTPGEVRSLCYPSYPDDLWWHLCAKMSGPAAEKIAIGCQFDDITWTADIYGAGEIQREYAARGITLTLDNNPPDYRQQHSYAFRVMYGVISANIDTLYSIASVLAKYDRIPLRKVIEDIGPINPIVLPNPYIP